MPLNNSQIWPSGNITTSSYLKKVLKGLKTSSILSLFLLLSSCENSPKDKYVGYWFEDDKKYSIPLQIVKEGEKLYVKAEKWETPATYSTEDHTLQFEMTNGLASLSGTLNLMDDKDKMKMNLGKNTAEFTRVLESEAKKRIQENKEYYDPSFFIGKWKKNDFSDQGFTITQEGDKYYYQRDQKVELRYDDKAHKMIYKSLWFPIELKRTGEQEMIMNGNKTYQRVK